MAVLPNGDATFCVDFPDYVIGNVYKSNVLEILNGEKSKKFRQYIIEKDGLPLCARCPHRFDKDEFLINGTER